MDAPDTVTGHVPDGLVYGPVQSRRFGTSLGVGFSACGLRACAWRCPYCQLGHLPDDDNLAPIPASRILAQVERALAEHNAIDCITIAGSGEPTTHPECGMLLTSLAELAREAGCRVVLLTNGDGIGTTCRRTCLLDIDVWLKWDPGPRGGSWRREEGRAERLGGLQPLQIQALLFDSPGGGNANPAAFERWCFEVKPLGPVAVQVTTIDRAPPGDGLQPVSAERLQGWCAKAAEVLGCPVSAHPATAS